MRSILMSLMLIVVVMVIYISTIGGENGAKEQIQQSGSHINHTIERINMYGKVE